MNTESNWRTVLHLYPSPRMLAREHRAERRDLQHYLAGIGQTRAAEATRRRRENMARLYLAGRAERWTIESRTTPAARLLPTKRRSLSHHPLNVDGDATAYRVTNGIEGTNWTTWPLEAEEWKRQLSAGFRPVAAQVYRLG